MSQGGTSLPIKDACSWCHGSGKRLTSDSDDHSGSIKIIDCENCSGTGKINPTQSPVEVKGNDMEDSAKMRAAEARMKKTDTPFLDEVEGKKIKAEDVMRIAFGHLILGVKQSDIAAMYGVNSGRVAEIVVAMRYASSIHMELYKSAKAEDHG